MLRGLVFLVVVPVVVAVLGPWLLSGWMFGNPFFGWMPSRAVGLVLVAGGVFVFLRSLIRFGLRAEPSVRSRMYAALVAIVFGQAFFFADLDLLIYGVVVWAAAYIFARAV